MSASAHISSDPTSIREVVGEERQTALSSGAVKDSSSQSLSTLANIGSVASSREGVATAKADRGRRRAAKSAAANHRSGVRGEADAIPHGGEGDGKNLGVKRNDLGREGAGKAGAAKGALSSRAVHELDDTPEFEGIGDAYDKARVARRASHKAKGAADALRKLKGGKAVGAEGAAKKAAGKAAKASGVHIRAEASVAKGAAVAAQKAATAKTIGAAASSAAAPVAGVLAGFIAFVLGILVVSQAVSAIFGFWENEASKQSMEGLPPYITYEMVEAALECQEKYGHPAGCTLAQIIAESGQGDHMSQLATRDHNLFGMKWSSSFAPHPEVTGKSGWSTKEEYTPGTITTITAYFTCFKSDVDCIRFRSRVFLQSSNYANNALIKEAISTKSSDKMAEGLKDAGWATSSAYTDSLKAIMDTYGLRRFDGMSVEDFKSSGLNGDAIVAAAQSQLGVPYVWGGTTPNVGLDCSGLTQYCYKQAGISIPRNSEDQYRAAKSRVSVSQAAIGDILYRPGHVAVYIGNDQYIHEPHSGASCTIAQGASYFTCALKFR